MSVISYNILDAVQSPDEVREMGTVDPITAVSAFNDYPFSDQWELRNNNPNLTVPTITYHNEDNDSDFAIWSEKKDRFTIWYPDASLEVSGDITTDEITHCIELFCLNNKSNLQQYIAELQLKYDTAANGME
jgi:hypothetical protein